MKPSELRREFGDIDIYLFDQLHRGRITAEHRILDAGCGEGRNLVYLLREGLDVWGVDADAAAVEKTTRLARELAPQLPAGRFITSPVERMPYADGSFDVVLSSAVLHFARDEEQWWAMVREMWRVLAAGGLFFARLASTVGHEDSVRPLGGRRYVMPDGEERLLIDRQYLEQATEKLGGKLEDRLKTAVVHGLRSMCTWVVRKP